METAKRHDWGLVVAGVLLVALALFFTVAPGLTLVTITAVSYTHLDVYKRQLAGSSGVLGGGVLPAASA